MKYKETVGTKNNPGHVQLGQILDEKDTKRPKNPTATFEVPGAKTGCWQWKQGTYCTCALHSTLPKGWANRLSHPSGLSPGHTPTFTSYKEQARETFFIFAPSCYSRGPSKALPEFLVWPLVNFWLGRTVLIGKAKNPGRLTVGGQQVAALGPTTLCFFQHPPQGICKTTDHSGGFSV